MNLLPILLSFGGIEGWVEGFSTWLPRGRTNLTILVNILEGLDESKVLINISSDWEVVN